MTALDSIKLKIKQAHETRTSKKKKKHCLVTVNNKIIWTYIWFHGYSTSPLIQIRYSYISYFGPHSRSVPDCICLKALSRQYAFYTFKFSTLRKLSRGHIGVYLIFPEGNLHVADLVAGTQIESHKSCHSCRKWRKLYFIYPFFITKTSLFKYTEKKLPPKQ